MEYENMHKIPFAKAVKIAGKAFNVSINVKGKGSVMVSIIGLFAAFLPVISARFLENLTNELYALVTGSEMTREVSTAISTFAMLIGLYMVQSLFDELTRYTLLMDTTKTERFVARTIMDLKCSVKYRYLENNEGFKQKLTFVEEYAGEYTARSMQDLILNIQRLISILSVSAELFSVSWIIVSVIFLTCVPAAILSYIQSDATYHFRTKWMLEGDSTIMQFITCVRPEAMKDIRHFKAYPYLKKEWKKTATEYIRKKDELTKKHVAYNMAADILRNAVYIIILILAGKHVYAHPENGIGVFMLVLTLTASLQNLITAFFMSLMEFGQNISYMEDYFELLDLEKDGELEDAEKLDAADVSFENVSFAYPGSVRKVIQNLTVDIHNGETVAIVGENGSGKSTFINLLMGFYTPDKGRIMVNGKTLEGRNIDNVRKSTAAVFQDFCHYEGTVRENIEASEMEDTGDEERIKDILVKANIEEMVAHQPDGLDEEIGKFSKTGNNLSGGQWQRIALARALYRHDTSLMILDEPTAALDPMAEAELYKHFAEMTKGKTTILISHRLGITRMVDRVLVFKEGKIIESGTHDELMAEDGYYAEMYRAQARWYEK